MRVVICVVISLKYHIGIGYWDNVVNKEDFNTNLIPVETFNPKIKTDITANFKDLKKY